MLHCLRDDRWKHRQSVPDTTQTVPASPVTIARARPAREPGLGAVEAQRVPIGQADAGDKHRAVDG